MRFTGVSFPAKQGDNCTNYTVSDNSYGTRIGNEEWVSFPGLCTHFALIIASFPGSHTLECKH